MGYVIGVSALALAFLIYHFHTVIVAKIDAVLEKAGLIHTTVTSTATTAAATATAVSAVQTAQVLAASPAANTVVTTTTPVPAGMTIAADGVALQSVTPADAFATLKTVSTPQGVGYQNGLNWNQCEYLRRLDAKAFGAWCFAVSQLPAASSSTAGNTTGTNSYGWLTGLSSAGQGFFMTLATVTPPIQVPATDPR